MSFGKRSLLIVMVVLLGSGAAFAQKNSIVGKWKLSSISVEGLDIDLENPESTKKLLSDQIEKETGKEPDSAMLVTAYTMVTTIFQGMQIEFTSDGKSIFVMPEGPGTFKKDTATYTVDYEKGILSTTSKKEGVDKKEENNIKFEGDYLVMVKLNEKIETIRLKRAK